MRPYLCFCLSLWAVTATAGDIAGDIVKMTGARTKLVWMRGMNGRGNAWNHPGDKPNSYRLMVFDTAEGKERELCPGPAAFSSPQINYDGTLVFYTHPLENNIYCVEFATGKSSLFCHGSLCCLWRDPLTGVEYVLYGDKTKDKPGSHMVFRAPVRDATCVDTLMGIRQCDDCTFRLSEDGTIAGGWFGSLGVGLVLVPEGQYLDYRGACNSSLAPDNSYALWHMVGDHNEVVIKYEFAKPEISRTVLLNKHPKLKGLNIWNPRWSNNVRFLTINGPWPESVHHYAPAHIWLCKFNEKLDDIAQMVQVSDYAELDFEAWAWIQPKGLMTVEGIGPLAGISAPDLQGVLRTLATAQRFTPVLDSLKKMAANPNLPTRAQEARQVTAQLESWGRAELARAKEMESCFLGGADKVYRDLAAKFEGHDIGAAAQQALRDPAFQQDVRLWPTIEQMLAAEKALKESPGARHSAADEKFAAANGPALETLRQTAAELTRQNASARVMSIANQALTRCELLPREPLKRRGPAVIGIASDAGWPGARPNVVFLWERQNKPVTAFEADGTPFQAFALKANGKALFDRHYAMALNGGFFSAEKASTHILKSCQGGLSMEAYVTPANLDAVGPAAIIAFGGNFVLGQDKNKLVLSFKTATGDKAVELCSLKSVESFHLVICYTKASLRCYLDGKEVLNKTDIADDWGRWTEGSLTFGALPDGQRPWSGSLEGIVFYRCMLEPAAIQQDCAGYLARIQGRQPPTRIELQAKLVAASTVPNYQQIAPYRNVLAVCEYAIEKVVSGSFNDQKMRVASWGMIDEKLLPISKPEIGKACHLIVEPFTENPQLQNEYLSDTLPDAMETTLYYDITP